MVKVKVQGAQSKPKKGAVANQKNCVEKAKTMISSIDKASQSKKSLAKSVKESEIFDLVKEAKHIKTKSSAKCPLAGNGLLTQMNQHNSAATDFKKRKATEAQKGDSAPKKPKPIFAEEPCKPVTSKAKSKKPLVVVKKGKTQLSEAAEPAGTSVVSKKKPVSIDPTAVVVVAPSNAEMQRKPEASKKQKSDKAAVQLESFASQPAQQKVTQSRATVKKTQIPSKSTNKNISLPTQGEGATRVKPAKNNQDNSKPVPVVANGKSKQLSSKSETKKILPAGPKLKTKSSKKQNGTEPANNAKKDAAHLGPLKPASKALIKQKTGKPQKQPTKQKAAAVEKAPQKSNNGEARTQTKLLKLKKARRAFQKQQRLLKRQKSCVESAEESLTMKYEAPQFDEAKFESIVNESNIKKIAAALKTISENEAQQKSAVFKDFVYNLNVSSFKIPSCPHRYVKLHLKHSLVCKGEDVPIIVADLQRGGKFDYEPTIQHYEDKFRAAGVTGLSIIPFNKVKKEMKSFEERRKFCGSYSYYLCDGRFVSRIHGFFANHICRPRNVFHSVRTDSENIAKTVDQALCRTAYRQIKKGDLISIPIANHEFTEEQVAENVMFVVRQLQKIYPGGWPNIRRMHLTVSIPGTSAVPIYISTAQPPAEAPYVVGPREQRMLQLKRVANEELTSFVLSKEGKLIKLNAAQAERKRLAKEARLQLQKADADETSDDGSSSDSDAIEFDDDEDGIATGSASEQIDAEAVSDRESENDDDDPFKSFIADEADDGTDSEDEEREDDEEDDESDAECDDNEKESAEEDASDARDVEDEDDDDENDVDTD